MGGRSKPKQHTPYDQPDTIKSYQEARIIDVISEGEVEGLVDDLQGVFFDDTPLKRDYSNYNFKNVLVQGAYGTPNQSPLDGFNDIEREVGVNVEVKFKKDVTRTITAKDLKGIRLTMQIPALFKILDNGDNVANFVPFRVMVKKDNTTLYTAYRKINEKSSSVISFNLELNVLPKPPFNIVISRDDQESTNNKARNSLIWAGYTEIIDGAVNYPNTAYVGVRYNSENFSGVPRRTYLLKGLQIPQRGGNVNSSSLWGGYMETKWSDNPVWVLYDICTNKRYGLGDIITEDNIDKWSFNNVANFCNETVPDGVGGYEKRYTCNVALTKEYTAYELINNISSIFKGYPVWNGQQLSLVADVPQKPVYIYTNANVVEGIFNYSSTPRNTRYSVIHVEYVDKRDGYLPKVAYVEDEELIKKYGYKVNKITAFGCTSIGQATRMGKWILESIKTETVAVTFSVGNEGLMHRVGEVLEIADNHVNKDFVGGRFDFADNQGLLQFKRPFKVGENPKMHMYLPSIDYLNLNVSIKQILPNNQVFAPTPYVGKNYLMSDNYIVALSSSLATPKLFRCVSIEEQEDGTRQITAIQHNPDKLKTVDKVGKLPQTYENQPPPKIVKVVASENLEVRAIEVRATKPSTNKNITYIFTLYKEGKFVRENKMVYEPFMYYYKLTKGNYMVEVRTRYADGQISPPTTATFKVDLVISNIKTQSEYNAISGSFEYGVNSTSIDRVDVFISASNKYIDNAKLVKTLRPPNNTFRIPSLKMGENLKIYFKAYDKGGNPSTVYTAWAGAINNINETTQALKGKVDKTLLSPQLVAEINKLTEEIRILKNKK